MKRIAAMVLIVFLLPACAPSYPPLVDPATIVDRDKYERDLAEWGAIADQNVKSHQAATGAVGGALWGAGLGALLSWIFGGSAGTGAAGGAVLGGVGGAASGAGATAGDYETIYRNCMLGRGGAGLR